MSVEIWIRQNGVITDHHSLNRDESKTIFTKVDPPGMIIPAFIVRSKHFGVDIIGDNNVIHLPGFQLGSRRMLQRATMTLPDKVVEIELA